MKNTANIVGGLFLILLGMLTNDLIAQTTLIDKEDMWTYLDDGSDQGTSWIDSGFDVSSWEVDQGIFGKGGIIGATQSTPVTRKLTTYYRKEVTLGSLNNSHLELNLLCDDGAVVYINGKEAFRYNMPTGTITYLTEATVNVDGAEEGNYTAFHILDTFLIEGVNTFAVELHNFYVHNQDIALDLEVTALDLSDHLITSISEWQYHDSGANLGTSWYGTSYNDSNWLTGERIFGYGTIDGASITTTIDYGSASNNRYPTTYFRQTFDVSDSTYTALQLDLLADDGAVIYLNGVQILEVGMPSTWDYSTYALHMAEGDDEGDYERFILPVDELVTGTNVIAVEIHNVGASNNDLGFNLELVGLRGRYVSGNVFMDMDANSVKDAYDSYGSGAVEIEIFNDANNDGVYTADELLNSSLTDALANYSYFLDDKDSVTNLVVKLSTEDLDASTTFTTDTVLNFTLSAGTDTIVADFGMLGPRSLCVVIADDQGNQDEYYLVNRISGKSQFAGQVYGRDLIEAMALKIGMDSLWACDEGQFGSVDLLTGEFTEIGTGMGTASGILSGGTISTETLNDVDGMAFDPINGILYGVERRNGAPDLLFVINRGTGSYQPDFFGAGIDFVKIIGTRVMVDVDDIAFNPYSGQLLAVNNRGNGDSARYITIDPATGSAEVLSFIGVGDFEGMGYYNTGELYGTTGVSGTNTYSDNTIYQIDRNTGVGTEIATLTSETGGATDLEACDCLTGPLTNVISGVVFYDDDVSGSYNREIDSAHGGFKVYLYRDVDGDGIITSADRIIDSTYSQPTTGLYVFVTDSIGDFLMRPVIAGTAFDTFYTTTSQYMTESASFVQGGSYDGGNDFGFHTTSGQPYLPVSWRSIQASWLTERDGLVEWSTFSEVNASHFELERMGINEQFEPIAVVSASGHSEEVNNYAYVDANVKELKTSFIFYRVKQHDFDGASSYSEIVSLKNDQLNDITAFPTLVNDYVNVLINGIGEYKISILDVQGTEIIVTEGNKRNELAMININNLSQLPSGLYFLKVDYNGQEKVIKIVK